MTWIRRSTLLGVLAVVCSAAVATAQPVHGAGGVRFFHSPSGNIQCEVDWHRSGVADGAYCQTFAPARSVTLRASGALKLCSGEKCVGNGPENAFTLAYGRTTAIGPFRCTSLAAGMRCTLTSGRGFELSRAALRRLPAGPAASPVTAAMPRAGTAVEPAGKWCPTNRTCFDRGVTWKTYGTSQAIGTGLATLCTTGSTDCPAKVVKVVLSEPKVGCGKLSFTKLTMLGQDFAYSCLARVYQ